MKLDLLIGNVQNNCDIITNACIEFLSYLSKFFGITYGELNVLIFLIIIPIVFMLLVIMLLISINTRNIKIIKTIKYILYLILISISFIFIFIVNYLFTIPIEYI